MGSYRSRTWRYYPRRARYRLTPRERRVWNLRILGCSFADIGDRLHISRRAAASLYRSARVKLIMLAVGIARFRPYN